MQAYTFTIVGRPGDSPEAPTTTIHTERHARDAEGALTVAAERIADMYADRMREGMSGHLDVVVQRLATMSEILHAIATHDANDEGTIYRTSYTDSYAYVVTVIVRAEWDHEAAEAEQIAAESAAERRYASSYGLGL